MGSRNAMNNRGLYWVCGFALYALWGLLTSALLFNFTRIRSSGVLITIITCVIAAGLMPVALHLYEVRFRGTMFSWQTVFISLFLGGIAAIMFGTILQGLLLLAGVRSICGIPIDTWYWVLPTVDY